MAEKKVGRVSFKVCESQDIVIKHHIKLSETKKESYNNYKKQSEADRMTNRVSTRLNNTFGYVYEIGDVYGIYFKTEAYLSIESTKKLIEPGGNKKTIKLNIHPFEFYDLHGNFLSVGSKMFDTRNIRNIFEYNTSGIPIGIKDRSAVGVLQTPRGYLSIEPTLIGVDDGFLEGATIKTNNDGFIGSLTAHEFFMMSNALLGLTSNFYHATVSLANLALNRATSGAILRQQDEILTLLRGNQK